MWPAPDEAESNRIFLSIKVNLLEDTMGLVYDKGLNRQATF